LTKRVVSGLMCALLLFSVIALSNFWSFSLNLAVAVISCLAVYEIISLKKEFKFDLLSIFSIIFSFIKPLFGQGTKWKIALYLYAIVCFFLAMDRFIKQKKDNCGEFKPVLNVCFIFFITVIISVSLGTIIDIRNFGKSLGIFCTLLALGIAWSCDIGAYYGGKILGKNKLCPDVSPRKTVEGAILGVISSVVYSIVLSLVFQYFFKVDKINYLSVVFMSIIGAHIAVLGDLCFSLIKRLLFVKDFGEMIPGHGGILDRFDSVIFAAPFVLIYLNIFSILG